MAALDVVGKILKRLFGSRNERLVKRYRHVAEQIAALEPQLRGDYDTRFEARLATADLDGIDEAERKVRIQQVHKELSADLARQAAELKWRLTPAQTFDQIVPTEYTISEADKWERSILAGHPLTEILPTDLQGKAAEITERLEQSRTLADIVPNHYLEPAVDQWSERLKNGESLEAVLPSALKDRAEEFRIRMNDAEPIDEHLPMAFALLREASRRTQEHRHFECQLIGGQVLYHGSVAEMKTGEGKTIVCHLAAFLKVLQSKHVHIVTVNDYLVRRDAEFARPVFELLGFTVGYIQSQVDPGGYEGLRKPQYECDITYGTNNEFGFDYLRDNMKMRATDQVQGPLNYAIVDEVDSILIDEARTPLIISGPARGNPSDYKAADDYAVVLVEAQKKINTVTRERLANLERTGIPEALKKHPKFEDAFKRFKLDPYMLTEEEAESIGHTQHFVVQRDRKQAHLTHEGADLAAKTSGLGSFYLEENMHWPHLIENALRARLVYERDKEYVVQNREIIIVDEFTGRLMQGRQWSDGLHQAVEAKHRNEAEIKQETQTLATITLQNYFKLYDSLAGMTGTAMTESDEFMKIYRLEVIEIPTNRPVDRNDHNDRIYRTIVDKYNAIVDEIRHVHRRGRPNDPFVLSQVFEQLKPICQKHAPEHVARIEEALRQFHAAENMDPKVIAFMCDVYDEVMGSMATGRPVLVGTTSVENSEKLQTLLLRRHPEDFPQQAAKGREVTGLEVLNAKFHEREAEIVAKAGWQYESRLDRQPFGNVTIATNMAGRGTDIKLQKSIVYEKCKGPLAYDGNGATVRLKWHERNPDGSAKVGTKCCIRCPDYDGTCDFCWKPKLDSRFPELGRKVCPLNSPCGLHIVGTERHEARRIDNQLRGRSGRQGDPGSSRFFLSLEDDLLRLFMPDWMLKMMEKLGFVEGVSLEDKRISKGIERAQKKVEERNFSTRKHLLEWDEPMDYQRKAFYRERQSVLVGRSQEPIIRSMFDDAIDEAATRFLAPEYASECIANWCRETLKLDLEASLFSGLDADEIKSNIRNRLIDKSRDDVTNVLGEYIDPETPAEEWDVRGLSRWASSLGASMTENQLRKMDPEEIEQKLLEAAETQAEQVNLDNVEAYLTPRRGLDDLIFWASRKFDATLTEEETREENISALRSILRHKVHNMYESRRAAFPVEWIIHEAYARRDEGTADSRWGHEALAGWAGFKYGQRWNPDDIQQNFGGEIQKIGDAVLDMQRRCLSTQNASEGNPLAQQVEYAVKQSEGKIAKLRGWARERFRDAFDDAAFDAAVGDEAAMRDALMTMGRAWLCWEFSRFENALLLRCYDEAWMDHLLEMDHLKYAIMQRPLGGDQTHPQSQYAIEGREYFEKMWGRVREAVLSRILRVRPSGESGGRSIYQATVARHDESTGTGFQGASPMQAGLEAQGETRVTEPIKRSVPRVKPNDPCPCNSGKKYKKCCGSRGAKI